MTLTLPPELAGLVARAGGRWPQADEDRLQALGGAWRSLAGELRTLRTDGSGIARGVGSEHEGASVEAFTGFWAEFERRLDSVITAVDAVAQAAQAMAGAVLATKTAIAKGAASVYGKILEVRRRAGMSGGIWCAVGVAIAWLLRLLGRFILRLLGRLLRWIWKGIVWLLRKAGAIIAAAYRWFKNLFKGKKRRPKQQPKKDPWSGGKPPKEAQDKVPKEWGEGSPTKKAVKNPAKAGWRWRDPNNPPGNGIRIDKGDPNSPWPSQRVDHVVVQSNGKTIGRDGNPVTNIKQNAEQSHIPLDEWLKWKSWSHP